ncbi:MAG: serine/threonine-protein kinase, partial [Verrucomicrobia bacterium]|nr:serine/threonine-protein kinase [Verrucomicrobiota bacterium]
MCSYESADGKRKAGLRHRSGVGLGGLRTHGGLQDSHDPSATGSRSSSPAPTSGGAPSGLSNTIDIPLSITEKPSDRIGRYKLLEEIGKGGFGSVWMAEQEEPIRRRVALKIIKLGMDTREVVARFQAERQALAMMDHPNIASVYDGGATETGRPYFVMELVRGVPITEYCDSNMLTTRERLELFTQVCNAVQHAHQKGIIHRDLKPSNILVTERDDQAVVKVIDFGVAKATQARLTEKTLFTQFRQFIGTPVHMSPEQTGLGGLDIDTRSDIYALGVMLYELLTGQTPFDTQKMMEGGYDTILRTIREGEPPKPSTRLNTLSAKELTSVAAKRRAEPAKLGRLVRGDLDWIVMKALEKDRQRRYQTASAFAQDLQHYLHNEPVEAVAPSVRYQVVKFIHRHQVGVAFAAAMALLAALGFAGVVWQWRRAQATAVAEARAKAEATQLSALAVDRLSQMQIQRAHEMLGSNQVHQALASLA